jgi:hypothetical protein
MREHRPEDEDDRLTDNPTLGDVADALADGKTRAIMLHKPGEVVTMRSKARYQVQPDGSWRKLKARELLGEK